MTPRRWLIAGILATALFLLAGRAIAAIYVDHQWYAAMDATAVWRSKALAWLAVRGTSALLATLFVFANLYAVRHSVVSLVLPRRVANIEIGEEVPGRYLVAGAAILAVILGLLLTLRHEPWTSYVLARSGLTFGERDPYFDAELGYYVAWLPFESALHVWALITVLLAAAVVIFLYALTPSLRWERGALYVSMYVQRHLIILGALLLLVLAWSYRLDGYELLITGSGAEGAFGYADHRARLHAATWLSFLTVLTALVVAWFGWTGQNRIALGAVGVLFLLALALGQGGPPLVTRMAPVQDAAVRERPYLATRAEYTRRAFGLERVLRAESALTPGALRDAVRGISVWDPAALDRAVARQRRASNDSIGVGWSVDGLSLIATVPLQPTPSDEELSPWGAQLILAAAADPRGTPVTLTTPDGRESVDLPRVLVHPGAAEYRLVGDTVERVAAPALHTSLARLAHAWSRQNFRLLVSDLPGPVPKLVDRRDVRERVRALAPFFAQGGVVSPVIALDSLFWTVELYAASSWYPLADRVMLNGTEYNYLKHAGTAIVNAHSGRVLLVADTARDAITERWVSIFPRLFRRWSEVPSALGRRLPPAVESSEAQAQVMARYGLRGEATRNGELPFADAADSALAAERAPQMVIAGAEPTTAWTRTVLDGTSHVAGTVVAIGGRHRATYWVPLEHQGPRWTTGVTDPLRRVLDSTAAIPRETRTVRGRIRAVPIGSEVAFVQPMYAWRADGVPSLARVAIVGPSGVASGRTLAEAIGVPAEMADTGHAVGPEEFRARVARLYGEMRDAMQRGDWTAFGRAYEALGALLGRAP